jgi:hypothetical protein
MTRADPTYFLNRVRVAAANEQYCSRKSRSTSLMTQSLKLLPEQAAAELLRRRRAASPRRSTFPAVRRRTTPTSGCSIHLWRAQTTPDQRIEAYCDLVRRWKPIVLGGGVGADTFGGGTDVRPHGPGAAGLDRLEAVPDAI